MTLHIIVMNVYMYILYKAMTWLRINNRKTTQLSSVFIIYFLNEVPLQDLNVNKHNTISSFFVRLEIEPTTTLYCATMFHTTSFSRLIV